LEQRLRTARQRNFVGRSAELELFRAALSGDPGAFAVLFLHGPGGIGKSTLMRRFADEAAAAGRAVVEVDCRTLPPSPDAFEADAVEALSVENAVLLVDTFERCQGLETWLLDQFLPRLPAEAIVVLAGRRPPDPRWRADAGWGEVLRVVALRNLPPDDAVALLRARGVRPELHDPLLGFTGGHPLALRLAAEVAVQDENAAATWTPTRDVVQTLLTHLVGDVPSTAHRTALEVCAHTRTTTEELLRAALPGEDAAELFSWLRSLPFVESGPHGLFPHDVVRDALDADLRWRDQRGYEEMHRRIHDHLAERARTASGSAVLPAAAAVLHLQRHGGADPRDWEWRGEGEVYEDVISPDDRAALLALAASEGAESAAVAAFWLDRQPGAFRVYRRSDTRELVAFMAWLELTEPREDELVADPVAALAWDHVLATAPLRQGEHLAIQRFSVKTSYFDGMPMGANVVELRTSANLLRAERMGWSFMTVAHAHTVVDMMRRFDMELIPGEAVVGERVLGLFAHDWRVVPLPRWLEHVDQQVLSGGQPQRERRAVELSVLSRPEFDTAVRDALRAWHQPEVFAVNPLLRSRLVAERGGDAADVLRDVLVEAVDDLRADPRAGKQHRALAATFFQGAATQEVAAERLGLPFSTYRRHLSRGLEGVCDRLWQREVHGSGHAAGA
jgi:hypothetical protein